MDRLSSYASRESETESPEDRQKNEQEALSNLLETLRISKEKKQQEDEMKRSPPKQPNGEDANGKNASATPNNADEEQSKQENDKPSGEANGQSVLPSKHRGIPDDVRLYEIFYDQVTHLVSAQRLQIHDTVALLVSLANLAL